MANTNYFFVFEGIDGSGKTTLSKLVAENLKAQNRDVIWHREPTDGLHGKKIRSFLSGRISLTIKEQLELFILDRTESVSQIISPNIEKGAIIVQDRYYYSTAAYQAGKEISAEEIIALNEKENFPKPKQVFFLDITPEEARERRKNRGGSEEAFDDDHSQNRIYENYMKILPAGTIFLDASHPLEDLVKAVMECIEI
ncbi:dTMP kinase [Leptospira ilyithenensis]|uniref:Thymidylate kinase n=1 Tax=Leptospira ilyithenensis TaxID=2484901 RepID=A0A4R9LQG1_9LEPT|nr:dTMP kinase [Leptospira ilyithenensis]TGN10080.1 dTMP kinase [Leptospira ilyithenensis]